LDLECEGRSPLGAVIHFDGSVVRFDDGSEDRDIQSRDAFPEPEPGL
jgi:hypothetical protein